LTSPVHAHRIFFSPPHSSDCAIIKARGSQRCFLALRLGRIWEPGRRSGAGGWRLEATEHSVTFSWSLVPDAHHRRSPEFSSPLLSSPLLFSLLLSFHVLYSLLCSPVLSFTLLSSPLLSSALLSCPLLSPLLSSTLLCSFRPRTVELFPLSRDTLSSQTL